MSTAEERLVGVRAKIERANQHIDELNGALFAFRNSNPYRMETYRDSQTGQQVHRVASVEPVPAPIRTIVGDVIHNLRSALDHLACQLVQVGTGNASCGKHTYFPTASNATEYEKAIQGKVQGAREDAKKKLRRVEAYKGGQGEQIWALNELDNADKHRLLLTVAARYAAINFEAFMPPGLQHIAVLGSDPSGNLTNIPVGQMMGRTFDVRRTLCPLKAGDELFRGIPNAEMNDNVKPTAEIAIYEPDITQPESVLKFLTQLSKYVECVARSFDPCFL